MADNLGYTEGSGKVVSSKERSDASHTQVVYLDISAPGGAPSEITAGQKTMANSLPVVLPSDQTVPVSAAALPLPSGAATSANQSTQNASLSSMDGKTPALGQALAAGSSPVVLTAAQITTLTPPAAITGFATETTLATRLSESDFDAKVGSLTEAAPASDTGSSGLNGRLQRIAQRITSLIALIPAALTGSGNFKISIAESTATVTADTELPAAAALADAAANPTTPSTGACNLIWNTATWDRIRSAAHGMNTTGTGLPVLALAGEFDNTSPTAITEDQFGTLRMSANRNLFVNIRDNAGNERGLNIDASGNLTVASILTSIVPGVAATNLGKAEDAVAASGDTGIAMFAVRRDTPSSDVSAAGDYATLQVNSTGELYSSPAGRAAHDAAVAGAPNLIGAEARDSLGTSVQTGDAVRVFADRYGRLVVVKPKTTKSSSNGTAITTATDTSAVAAPSAGNHLKVHRLHVSNSGATATWVYFRDGVAGTKLYPCYLPQGGIASLKLEGSWELTTATALYVTTSAAGNVEYTIETETVTD